MATGADDKQMEALADLIAMKHEELHPDLKPYLLTGEGSLDLPILAHPLVHHVLPTNGIANRVYAQKKAALDEAIEAEDWETVIHLHERPYRCEALIEFGLGRDEYDVPLSVKDFPHLREITAWVWTDSENIHQHVDDWAAIFAGHEPGEPLLLGDQEAFDALPTHEGRIEVWRGDCNDGGWSWSTDRKIAEFFCARWGENNDLLHGWANKHDVFGYLPDHRGESEVMVRLSHVSLISRTPYPEGT